jgi:hypothetical protein
MKISERVQSSADYFHATFGQRKAEDSSTALSGVRIMPRLVRLKSGMHLGAGQRFLAGRGRRFLLLLAGALPAVVLIAGISELFLRCYPPSDLHIYLGEDSPATGPFAPHSRWGASYPSWEAFAADNEARLGPYLPLTDHPDSRPTWAFFGNSFIQAPGMLGDHAQKGIPTRKILYLGRNEYLFVRFAQVEMLLENGLKPERIVIGLMPLDTVPLGIHPLDTLRITRKGAMTWEPPGLTGATRTLANESRLALAAWLRLAKPVPVATTFGKKLHQGIPPEIAGQLESLFRNLAEVCQSHNVPVTVLLIPTHEQIVRGSPFAFQDCLTPVLREMGFDVLDPREAFRAEPDKPGLFIPDKHFSDAGNRILLRELLAHTGISRP